MTATPKICGIETEYGIISRGVDLNPVAASSLLISAYLAMQAAPAGWDYDAETPGVDARGFSVPDLGGAHLDNQLVSAVLTNGARYYVDHAHPEISTPECISPSQVLLYDRAAESIVRESMRLASLHLPEGAELIIHKNNSDGKGNSYGCHENYLVDRAVPFGRLASHMTAHFISRQTICGAGKVGSEVVGDTDPVPFQLSQRADFMEEEIGLETTLKRPIINTRDEPHSDPTRFRRLHVIVGDANLSEIATLVKIGSTALVLCLIEDDLFPNELVVRNPVPEIRAVSRNVDLDHLVELVDGRRITALEMQWTLFEAAEKYALGLDADPLGGDLDLVLREWRRLIEGLEASPESVADSVDWVAKRRIIDGYAARHGLNVGSPRLKAIDLQYSDMRVDRGLASRSGLRTLCVESAVRRAMVTPPDETRAFFRGECLRRWPEAIVAANWDGVVIDTGDDVLRRIPMMDPLRGSRELVGDLLDRSSTPADLVEFLGDSVEMPPESEPGW